MTDDGGVLENLPRSRPGRRSEKRASAGAGSAAKRPAARGAKTPSSGTRRRAEARRPQPAAERSGDPVGDVIRGAAKAAQTGARVAGALAQEVLRRVPRP